MLEIRDSGPKAYTVTGFATTWGQSERGAYFVANDPVHGTFLEVMNRNCFEDATAGRDAVELRREHAADSHVYASTREGTLRFTDETHGLFLAGALSKTDPSAQAAVAEYRAGTLTGLSVGMHIRADSWGTASDGRTALRTVTSASLAEVSMVKRAANPSASFDLRHEQRGERLEYRFVPVAEARLAANQHGQMVPCEDCDGSGQCATCDGSGQTWSDGDDDDGGARARKMGLRREVPGTSSTADLKLRVEWAKTAVLASEFRDLSRLARQHRGLTERDKNELVSQASRLATEARLRGDWREARTWDRVHESEVRAQMAGL